MLPEINLSQTRQLEQKLLDRVNTLSANFNALASQVEAMGSDITSFASLLGDNLVSMRNVLLTIKEDQDKQAIAPVPIDYSEQVLEQANTFTAAVSALTSSVEGRGSKVENTITDLQRVVDELKTQLTAALITFNSFEPDNSIVAQVHQQVEVFRAEQTTRADTADKALQSLATSLDTLEKSVLKLPVEIPDRTSFSDQELLQIEALINSKVTSIINDALDAKGTVIIEGVVAAQAKAEAAAQAAAKEAQAKAQADADVANAKESTLKESTLKESKEDV